MRAHALLLALAGMTFAGGADAQPFRTLHSCQSGSPGLGRSSQGGELEHPGAIWKRANNARVICRFIHCLRARGAVTGIGSHARQGRATGSTKYQIVRHFSRGGWDEPAYNAL